MAGAGHPQLPLHLLPEHCRSTGSSKAHVWQLISQTSSTSLYLPSELTPCSSYDFSPPELYFICCIWRDEVCGNFADLSDFCLFIQASPTSKGANANIDKFNKKTHLARKQLNRLPNEGVQGKYLKRKSACFTNFYILASRLYPK